MLVSSLDTVAAAGASYSLLPKPRTVYLTHR